MKRGMLIGVISIVSIGILLLAQPVMAGQADQEDSLSAHAEIYNRDGKRVGKAVLMEESGGVKVSAELENLPPGLHAFHIHGTGKCDLPDFKSASGHFNPDHKHHGLKNPEGAHVGDMPNLVVEADGTGKIEAMAWRATISDGDHSLFHPGGTAIVIHAGPDDYASDPAGAAGPRIACGVIVKG